MAEQIIHEVFNSETNLEPESWDKIKDEIRTLSNNQLREFVQLTNPIVKYMAKSILHERGAIKL